MFILNYPNKNDSANRFNGKKYHLPKGIIKNDIIKIIKSLEDSSGLIDVLTERVKNKIKNRGGFLGAVLAPLAASLI